MVARSLLYERGSAVAPPDVLVGSRLHWRISAMFAMPWPESNRALVLPTLIPVLLLLCPESGLACGGFFCDGSSAVRQSGERILFEINDDDTVTTTVEIQYQGQPDNFSWVLPVPPSVDVGDITTTEPGLFDDLERATAPIFRWITVDGAPGFRSSRTDYQTSPPLRGCLWGSTSSVDRSSESQTTSTPDGDEESASLGVSGAEGADEVSEVRLVGEAVVGPYEIQLIATGGGTGLVDWLDDNGYQQPPGADAAIAPYVSAGMSFLGLRLDPEVSEGAIEAISFTYPGSTPMIPLVLTSVAAMPSMEIIAYVLGDQRYEPEAPYLPLPFDWNDVEPTPWGSNYTTLLRTAVETQQGKAFVTEYAGPSGDVGVEAQTLASDILEQGEYLSRFRTFIDPDEMTADPTWAIADSGEDVSNVHTIGGEGVVLVGAGLGPLALLLAATVRRTRRKHR